MGIRYSPDITTDKSPYVRGSDNKQNEATIVCEAGHIINNLLNDESKKIATAKHNKSIDSLLINIDHLKTVSIFCNKYNYGDEDSLRRHQQALQNVTSIFYIEPITLR